MNRTPKIILSAFVLLILNGCILLLFGFYSYLKLMYEPILQISDFVSFFSFVLGVLIIEFLTFYLLRNRFQNFSRGILFGLAPFYFILVVGMLAFYEYINPEPFDSETWKNEENKSTDMARYIIRNDILGNQNKTYTIELLGDDFNNEHSDEHRLVYRLSTARFAYLVVRFDDDEVVDSVYFNYWD